jgi:hypothetical protein
MSRVKIWKYYPVCILRPFTSAQKRRFFAFFAVLGGFAVQGFPAFFAQYIFAFAFFGEFFAAYAFYGKQSVEDFF